MVSAEIGLYTLTMTDLNKVMGERLRVLRKRLAGTQENFAERSGLEQVRISRLERGMGWGALGDVGLGIEQAGGDPMDLLSSEAPASEKLATIRAMLLTADEDTLDHVLETLRYSERMRRSTVPTDFKTA
jgi:hypothetical protein